MRLIDKFLPGDIYFDIGAHTGLKAEPYIESGYKVVLVEPQPKCVKILNSKYADRKGQVHLVPMGLGGRVGVLDLSINTRSPTISTFSEKWKKGRFSNEIWDETVAVQVTTLDKLIEKYGNPRYVKVDVEGFEYEVLQGLTRKSGIISFEFTAEYVADAIKSILYLAALGYEKFNFSIAEHSASALNNWVNSSDLCAILGELAAKKSELWGDVYAN
jgi:FkbM family methyltransferase